MRVLECLFSPVPSGGRSLSLKEAVILSGASGVEYTKSAIIMPATDDGWTAYVYGCVNQEFILVNVRGESHKVNIETVACLSSPVEAGGRFLAQYEMVRLRRADVVCSTSTFLKPLPDGSGASRWKDGRFVAGFPVLTAMVPGRPGRPAKVPVVPEGCCCWACAAVECPVRRAAGPGGER